MHYKFYCFTIITSISQRTSRRISQRHKFQEIPLRGRLGFSLVFDLVQNIKAFKMMLIMYASHVWSSGLCVRLENNFSLKVRSCLGTYSIFFCLSFQWISSPSSFLVFPSSQREKNANKERFSTPPAKKECMRFSWKCHFFWRKYDHLKRLLFVSIT